MTMNKIKCGTKSGVSGVVSSGVSGIVGGVVGALSLVSAANAWVISGTTDYDSDKQQTNTIKVVKNKGGIGFADTSNGINPFFVYGDFGLYLNKAPYLFGTKEFNFGGLTATLFLDSLDYEHTESYNKDLWYFGGSLSNDFILSKMDTLALVTNIQAINDGNEKITSKVNYTHQFNDNYFGLIRYKNVINTQHSNYYYSPSSYNSFQVGPMVSFKMNDIKFKIGLTGGYYVAETDRVENDGIVSEVFGSVNFKDVSISLVGKNETGNDESYKYVGLNFSIKF